MPGRVPASSKRLNLDFHDYGDYRRSRIRFFQGIIILTMKNMKGLKIFYFINFMSFMVIFQTVSVKPGFRRFYNCGLFAFL